MSRMVFKGLWHRSRWTASTQATGGGDGLPFHVGSVYS